MRRLGYTERPADTAYGFFYNDYQDYPYSSLNCSPLAEGDRLYAGDGGVFAFGDAVFAGSTIGVLVPGWKC